MSSLDLAVKSQQIVSEEPPLTEDAKFLISKGWRRIYAKSEDGQPDKFIGWWHEPYTSNRTQYVLSIEEALDIQTYKGQPLC